jgi:hypothetical protein
MRKLIWGLTPLLATAAFMVAPAVALAGTAYGVCGATGTIFSPPCAAGASEFFAPSFLVTNITSKSTTSFALENTSGEGIECKELTDKGSETNIAGVGYSVGDMLRFKECMPKKGVGTNCTAINPPTREIEGIVSDKVESETKVGVTIVSGFNVKCIVAGVERELGNIVNEKGIAVKGTATAKTNELIFNKAANLSFFGFSVTISGTDKTTTETGGQPIYIH